MSRAYSECHMRSAKRVLKALLANGGADDSIITEAESHAKWNHVLGVFIKLGQHMASLYVLNHCLDWHSSTP